MLLWERVEEEPWHHVKVAFFDQEIGMQGEVAYVRPNVVRPFPGPRIAGA